MTQRHPAHDAVAATLRRWYTTSAPEAGIHISAHEFGYLSDADRPDPMRVLLTVEEPGAVAPAIEHASRIAGADVLVVVVDDRDRATRLTPALEAAGCVPVKAITNLAHVGEFPEVRGPDDLALEPVDAGGLDEWSALKLRCFDPLDSVPNPVEVGREVAVRARELAVASMWTVCLGDEPVGVFAYYPGSDQLAYNLGTIAPQRHRGIARSVLARWVREGRAAGVRSLLINCDDPGRPQALYRSLGFLDEVYWSRRWSWRRR